MKLTNADLENINKPLDSLSKEKFPATVALSLIKALKEIAGHMVDYGKVRDTLITRYGPEKDGKPTGSINPQDPNWSEFAKEYAELLEVEVEVNIDIIKIPGADLKISPEHLMKLEKVIEIV